jgi:ketosteroid isomerase-like protein
MSNLEANKAVARAFFEHLNRGDIDGLLSIYADDLTFWTAGSLPFSGPHTRAEVRPMVAGVGGVFPDGLRFTADAMTAEGDRVAVEAHAEGRHVSGATYRQRYHFLFVVRDGKIQSFNEYFDTMHAHEVLCSAPAPGFTE